jgi:hypothetical protein
LDFEFFVPADELLLDVEIEKSQKRGKANEGLGISFS